MGQLESTPAPKVAENYRQLVADVAEANRIASNYSDSQGRKLLYRLEPQREEDVPIPMFWKQFVSVVVKKVPAGPKPCPVFELNIKQFYRMFRYMQDITSNGQTARPKDTAGEEEEDEDANECAICMERKACVLLDCTHAFCDVCLEGWHEKSNTCPMCRAIRQVPAASPKLTNTKSRSSKSKASTAEDWWIISEDTGQDMATYFDEFLMKLNS